MRRLHVGARTQTWKAFRVDNRDALASVQVRKFF
jgi:hypothetical protein